MAAWKLPLIVAAITLPIVGSFVIAGPPAGFAAGALGVVVLLVIAARMRPLGPIGELPSDGRHHLLLVVAGAIEEPSAVRELTAAAGLEPGGDAEVRVLAPARIRFLDRWTSDVGPARDEAQRNLVATVAALAKDGIEAEARVGDEDFVQAVEDQLRTYAADEVVLVSAGPAASDEVSSAVTELSSRLRADFRHVVLGG
ncbi:MAG TPA: hypothetical protein VHQ97_03870 [Solirubrobacterales bacterium]|jgi:hypothetical protein|nr:hypothetical protein [Solirubrobacterales bacterium]